MKAIYPGSFDPITNGHLDVISRTAEIFDELVIAVMVNPWKKYTFSTEERVAMIEKVIEKFPNVSVVADSGLTVDLAKKLNARILIRGFRTVMDYENELITATGNQLLNPEIETLFMVAKPTHSFISSSAVKEIAMYHGDVSQLVPEVVRKQLIKVYGEKE